MLIQNARLTVSLAIRGSAFRAVLLLIGLGFLAAQWPGLFDGLGSSAQKVERIWSTARLGAIVLAAAIPIQRWDQVRAIGAIASESRSPGFPEKWVCGVWLGSTLVALGPPLLATLWLAVVGGGGPPSLVAVVSLLASIPVTAALATALSTVLSRAPTLLALASLWTLGSILAQSRLPAGDAISIILPPVRLLSFATRTQWAGSPEANLGSLGLLALLVTAAALASAVGMARSRWN